MLALLATALVASVGIASGLSAAAPATSASSPPSAPQGLIGSPSGSTAIWWAWTNGGVQNNTLYLYSGPSCAGTPLRLNVPLMNSWTYLTSGLAPETHYSATVTAWSGGVQSAPSSCAAAVTGSPPGVSWAIQKGCGSGANALCMADTVLKSTEATPYAFEISATDSSAGTFVAWANSSSVGPTVGWQWKNGVWANVTAASNDALVAKNLYNSAFMGCMAWDPGKSGFIAVLSNTNTGPATGTPAYTYLFSGGVWSNLSEALTLPGGTTGAGHYRPQCSMAWDPSASYMVLVMGIAISGVFSPDYTWTFGSTWANITATAGTPKIGNSEQESSALLAWDSTDSELVMMGTSNWLFNLEATYTFAGGTWTNRTATTPYVPNNDGGGLLLPLAGGILAYGGGTQASATCSNPDTGLPYIWYFKGNAWSNESSGGTFSITTGSDSFAGAGCVAYRDWGPLGGAVASDSAFVFGGGLDDLGTSPTNASYWFNATATNGTPQGPGPQPGPYNTTVAPPGPGGCSIRVLSWTNPVSTTGQSVIRNSVFLYDSSGNLVSSTSTIGSAASALLVTPASGQTYLAAVQSWFSATQPSQLSGIVSFVSGCLGGAIGIFSQFSVLSLLFLLIIALAAVVYSVSRRRRGGGRRVGGRP